MKTYSKTTPTADSNTYQKAFLDSIFESEEQRLKSVKSISDLKKIGNFSETGKERKPSPFVKHPARARKSNLCVGRLPSRRPIKSPRLEPPRYVNALPNRELKDASDTEESDFNSQETTPVTQYVRAYIGNVGCPEIEQVRRDTHHAPVIGLHDLPKIQEIEDGSKDVEAELDPVAPGCADRPHVSACVSPDVLLDSPPLTGLPYRNSTLLHKNAIPIERFLPPKDISAITECPTPEDLQREQENTPAVKSNKSVPRRPCKSKRAIQLTKPQRIKTSTMYEARTDGEQYISFDDILAESTIQKAPDAPNGETVSCVEIEKSGLVKQATIHKQQHNFPEKFSSTPNKSGIDGQIFSVELSSVHDTVREGELPVKYSRFVNSEEIVPIYGGDGSCHTQDRSSFAMRKNQPSKHLCVATSGVEQKRLATSTPTSCRAKECIVKRPEEECIMTRISQECIMASPAEEYPPDILCSFPEDLPLNPARLKQSVISVTKMRKKLKDAQPIPDDILLDD